MSLTRTNMHIYVIVTPVRDEAAHIHQTLAAVQAQTVRPAQWIIVDDGSTDGTGAILDEQASKASWIRVVHRPNRGHRAAGGGVMEAFYAGHSALKDQAWDYIVKLDGDLWFAPDYFERCFAIFDAEPRLGIGGGTVCQSRMARLESTRKMILHFTCGAQPRYIDGLAGTR